MKTLKEFTEKSHINESLVRAVVRQSGGWEDFKEKALDVANHGAYAGFRTVARQQDSGMDCHRQGNEPRDVCVLFSHVPNSFETVNRNVRSGRG